MVNFGPLAAEIDPVVWGITANFNGFRVLAGRSKKRWDDGTDDGTLSRPRICKPLYGPSQGDETGN